MPALPSGHDQLAQWLRQHATSLAGLDPAAPIDDLEPLRDIIGDARVVAVGENSHFIREFSLARHRILRFLAERCGFTVYALEFGFSEGFPVDTWVGGAGQDDDLDLLSEVAIPWGVSHSLRWLRQHNHTAAHPVRFTGVGIPEAGGSLLPALTPLADYVRDVDPEALPMLDTARGIAEQFAAPSGALAAPAWARLETAEQDALSAVLARLLIRFRSVEPLHLTRSDRDSYCTTSRCNVSRGPSTPPTGSASWPTSTPGAA
jgi:erythromycin esterase